MKTVSLREVNILSQQPPAQYFLRTIFTGLVAFPASQIYGTEEVDNNKENGAKVGGKGKTEALYHVGVGIFHKTYQPCI